MNLYLKCTNCKYENSFKSTAATRVEYAMKYGKTKTLNCSKCNSKIKTRLNKIYAKESKLAYLLAGTIFLIGSILVLVFWLKVLSHSNNSMGLYAVALLFLIPVYVFIIKEKQERNRVNTFNRSYVSEYY